MFTKNLFGNKTELIIKNKSELIIDHLVMNNNTATISYNNKNYLKIISILL